MLFVGTLMMIILAETETGISCQVVLALMLNRFIPEVLGSNPSLGTGYCT
jgi:hypothetical protein